MLRTIKTEKADYYLGLGNHAKPSDYMFPEELLKKLDIMIFEDGGDIKNTVNIPNFPQYWKLYDNLINNNEDIKIYCTDVAPSPLFKDINNIQFLTAMITIVSSGQEIHSRRDFFKRIGTLGIGTALLTPKINSLIRIYSGTSSDKFPEITNDVIKTYEKILPSTILAFRDAVTSKKLVEYIVPKNYQGKKLNVGLIYGADHVGIEDKLINKAERDRVISIYHDMLGLHDKKYISEIRELTPLENGYEITRIYSDIF